MLAVFSDAIVTPPEELVQAGSRTPTPKQTASKLLDAFLQSNPCSMAINIGGAAQIAFTHKNQSSLQPRSFAVNDEIFCSFKGTLENLPSLKQHYGLAKNASEVVLVMEAYRALRDRAPHSTNQMLAHLVGQFAFVVFDSVTSTVFAAADQDGKVPLFLGITVDGYLAFSDKAEVLRSACGKSLASFPPGCHRLNWNKVVSSRLPLDYGATSIPITESQFCQQWTKRLSLGCKCATLKLAGHSGS